MSKTNPGGHSRPISGAVTAIVIILAGGVGYRVVAGWFERNAVMRPLPVGTLDAIPLRIDNWSGDDVPLDEAVIQRTDTDDHINRIYTRNRGRDAVSIFAGCGVKVRDLMPHRPEVCYTGAGWTLDETRKEDLTVAPGVVLPCQIQTFFRSGLDSGRIAVLNYYIVDGIYCPDVSLLRSKAWSFSGVDYVAQVQVAARTVHGGQSRIDLVRTFAVDSASAFRDALDNAVQRRNANEVKADLPQESQTRSADPDGDGS